MAPTSRLKPSDDCWPARDARSSGKNTATDVLERHIPAVAVEKAGGDRSSLLADEVEAEFDCQGITAVRPVLVGEVPDPRNGGGQSPYECPAVVGSDVVLRNE
jgi:hypothetical protein